MAFYCSVIQNGPSDVTPPHPPKVAVSTSVPFVADAFTLFLRIALKKKKAMNEARPLKTVGLVGMAGTLGLQRSIHLSRSDVMGYGEGEKTAEGGGGSEWGGKEEGERERMRTDWLCGSIKSFS